MARSSRKNCRYHIAIWHGLTSIWGDVLGGSWSRKPSAYAPLLPGLVVESDFPDTVWEIAARRNGKYRHKPDAVGRIVRQHGDLADTVCRIRPRFARPPFPAPLVALRPAAQGRIGWRCRTRKRWRPNWNARRPRSNAAPRRNDRRHSGKEAANEYKRLAARAVF